MNLRAIFLCSGITLGLLAAAPSAQATNRIYFRNAAVVLADQVSSVGVFEMGIAQDLQRFNNDGALKAVDVRAGETISRSGDDVVLSFVNSTSGSDFAGSASFGEAVVSTDAARKLCIDDPQKGTVRKFCMDQMLRITVLHAIGHAIGIQTHSRLDTDFMFDKLSAYMANWRYSSTGGGPADSVLLTQWFSVVDAICNPICSEPPSSAPSANPLKYYQQFTFDPRAGTPASGAAAWGFSWANGWWNVDPNERFGAAEAPLVSTAMTSNGVGSSQVAEAITQTFPVADRAQNGVTVEWSMFFPADMPNYVKATNLFAIALLDDTNRFLYAATYKPTGAWDPWSGSDFEISKNHSVSPVTLGTALSSTDTPRGRWIKFRFSVEKSGVLRLAYDWSDGAGFREILSVTDTEHRYFKRLYLAYLGGPDGSRVAPKVDDIFVSQGK